MNKIFINDKYITTFEKLTTNVIQKEIRKYIGSGKAIYQTYIVDDDYYIDVKIVKGSMLQDFGIIDATELENKDE